MTDGPIYSDISMLKGGFSMACGPSGADPAGENGCSLGSAEDGPEYRAWETYLSMSNPPTLFSCLMYTLNSNVSGIPSSWDGVSPTAHFEGLEDYRPEGYTEPIEITYGWYLCCQCD
jgi:hypothetical protein